MAELIASLLLSIIGLVAWVYPVAGFVIAVSALILGARALRGSHHDWAVAGMTTGSVGIMLSVAGFIFSLAVGLYGIAVAPAPP